MVLDNRIVLNNGPFETVCGKCENGFVLAGFGSSETVVGRYNGNCIYGKEKTGWGYVGALLDGLIWEGTPRSGTIVGSYEDRKIFTINGSNKCRVGRYEGDAIAAAAAVLLQADFEKVNGFAYCTIPVPQLEPLFKLKPQPEI